MDPKERERREQARWDGKRRRSNAELDAYWSSAEAQAAQAEQDKAVRDREARQQASAEREAARQAEIDSKVQYLAGQDPVAAALPLIAKVLEKAAEKEAALERQKAELRELLSDPEITRALSPREYVVLFDAGEFGPGWAPFRDKLVKTVSGAATHTGSTYILKLPDVHDVPVTRLAEAYGIDYAAMQTEGKDACYQAAKRLWGKETNDRLIALAKKYDLDPTKLIVGPLVPRPKQKKPKQA